MSKSQDLNSLKMGTKNCMNEVCRATTSDCKKGWSLKSGGFASLCYNCGSAYDNYIFCETFHSEDSGWRACRICGKMVHCGCVASRHLHEYMDFGGVACISCAKRLEIHSMQAMQIPSDIRNGAFVTKSVIRDPQPIVYENRINENKFSTERILQLTKSIGVNDVTSAFEQPKRDESMLKTPENPSLQSSSSSTFAKSDNNNNIRPKQGALSESLSHPSLNFTLTTTPLASLSSTPPFHGGVVEGSEQGKGSLQRTRHIVAKPPKPSPGTGPESTKGSSSQIRVPRPPAEGRGRSQLLPRYWPRITDQELQQLSGDLNSTIVPLFEKILSASDAGRIGRLVLPKACAEAYFPNINQSEGIPIKIQDIKGKEWTFQFRFWPNNNSRMYVLEGVTPCIQSMKVQAGDTVIFSRRDPGGQLVIGCRKATNNYDVQEPQTPAVQNGDPPENTSSSGGADNLLANGADDSQKQQMNLLEKKKARNIKNKRLHMHNDDAMELRITWEEAQELFRPSPSAEPTVFVVEDQEFEEFEEPPVFGKRTIFISQPSGEQEQVAQCDSCYKWRRLPVHALISANWTCAENVWDTNRCSCSVPEDINLRDPDLLKSNKEYKKQRISDSKAREGEPSGLDALANAAVLGDNIGEIGSDLASGATTRHPRHRPGCTCIVCIQPPSGKGKHEPMCKCNVCLTVKRRFKTLMMRKKKRQSEREAELAQDNNTNNNIEDTKDSKPPPKVDFGGGDVPGQVLLNMNHPRNETSDVNKDGNHMDLEDNNTNNKGHLDLNCDPRREDEILAGTSGMSLTTLINTAAFPLDIYLGQNGIPGLGSSLLSQASGAVDENGGGDEGLKTGDGKQENNRVDG